MARPLTFAMAEALRARRPLALLAEIEHPDATVRFWTGIGKLVWNNLVWTGSGTLGTVAPIKHTTDLAIQEISFTLAGVDPAMAGQVNDDVRNRRGRVWLACMAKGNAVVPEPFQIVDALLDYQTLSATEEGTTISIVARTGFYTLERALNETWTTEEQRLLYPDDSGLDLISELQNQAIQWTPT